MSTQICKNCGKPIEPIYPINAEMGYVHVSPDDLPDYQYCRKGGSWAEPTEESK
jgi:hypothetical protein